MPSERRLALRLARSVKALGSAASNWGVSAPRARASGHAPAAGPAKASGRCRAPRSALPAARAGWPQSPRPRWTPSPCRLCSGTSERGEEVPATLGRTSCAREPRLAAWWCAGKAAAARGARTGKGSARGVEAEEVGCSVLPCSPLASNEQNLCTGACLWWERGLTRVSPGSLHAGRRLRAPLPSSRAVFSPWRLLLSQRCLCWCAKRRSRAPPALALPARQF